MTERELIREVRRFVADEVLCFCRSTGVALCKRCMTLDMIDKGLAEIGQTNKEMMADDGYGVSQFRKFTVIKDDNTVRSAIEEGDG